MVWGVCEVVRGVGGGGWWCWGGGERTLGGVELHRQAQLGHGLQLPAAEGARDSRSARGRASAGGALTVRPAARNWCLVGGVGDGSGVKEGVAVVGGEAHILAAAVSGSSSGVICRRTTVTSGRDAYPFLYETQTRTIFLVSRIVEGTD